MPTPSPDSAPLAPPAAAPLPRRLGLLPATALNMIDMVGIGPFVTLPLVMGMMGPNFLLAWLVGAGLALVDGLVWSELGAAHPEAGGSYRFLKLAYGETSWGRLLSFLYVWQTLVQAPLVLASGAIGFAQYVGYLVPLDAWWQPKAVAGGIVLLLIALLYRRIEDIGRLGVMLWVCVLGLMGWLIFGGATHPLHSVAWLPTGGVGALPGLLLSAALGQAAVKTIYSYLGYYNVCHLGGEIKEPARNIPRAIFLSILGIMALYLAMNWAVGSVVSWEEVRGWQAAGLAKGLAKVAGAPDKSQFIVSVFVERLYGPLAAQIATGLVLLVAFASLFAVLLGYSRIPYAAAVDGEFLEIFGRLHPTKHFPYVSLLILGGVGFVFSLLFRLGEVISAILAIRVVPVNEIERGPMRYAAEQRALFGADVERVPPHMRDLQPRLRRKTDDFPGEQIQPGVFAIFPATAEQHLQPEADSEERPAAYDLLGDDFRQAGRPQLGDRIAERADSGENHFFRGANALGVGGDLRGATDFLERFLDAAQVGHSVIDDDDFRTHTNSLERREN